MKSSAFYAVLGVGIIVIVAIVWWGAASHMKSRIQAATSTPASASSTPSLTGMSIYTNGQYGFSIFYPGKDIATTTFSTYYHLPADWRVGALPNATGTPIVSIIGYQTQSNDSYPQYFDAEVRIGMSKDPREISACEKVGDGELPEADLVEDGTTWKAFAFESAGMLQYAKGVSYRTLHNGTCFAMEQVETGSTYRNDPASPKDIPQATLDQQFSNLASVVQSFSFVTQ